MSERAGGAAAYDGGRDRHVHDTYEKYAFADSIASSSSAARLSPHPETVACIRAPPISSRVTRSPTTISAIRGEPRYIDALPSTMTTTSQNDGMYAPPAALGPNRQQICGTFPDSATWLWKIRPAPRRPGNSSTWSVIRAPALSTNQNSGSSSRSAISVVRTIFSTVRAPHEPAFTVGSLATTSAGRPSTRPRPVTTPSAGRPLAWAFASWPSSTNVPSSNSSASRSRTYSLCCSRSLAAPLSEGASVASRAAATSL